MQLLSLLKELSLHPKNAEELKGLILQLALEGKLTVKWRLNHNDVVPAEHLLNEVTEAKMQMLKNKQIRKFKSPPVAEELQFQIPNTWCWTRMIDYLDVRDGTHDSPKYQPKGFPLVTSKNLYSKKLDLSNVKYISEEDHLEISKRSKVDKDDLLFAMIGSIGNPVIVNVEPNFSIKNVALIKYYKRELVEPYFVLYFLENATAQFKADSDGAVQSFVSLKKLRLKEFPLPPLEEQKAIVEVVNQLFAEVEQLEDLTKERISLKEDFVTSALRRLTETDNTASEWNWLKDQFPTFFTEKSGVKKLRETILQLAVQGKLTAKWRALRLSKGETIEPASELLKRIEAEKQQLIAEKKIKKEKPLPAIGKDEIPYKLPKGWVWCRVGEITSVRVGATPSRNNPSYWNGSVPWVSSGEVANNFIHETKQFITEKGLAESSVSIYPPGTVLVAMIGQGKTRGQTSVLKIHAGTNQNVGGMIVFHDYLISELLWQYFLGRYKKTRSNAVGGNQPAINGTKLKMSVFALPPFIEQKLIVDKVNSLMALCDELEQQIETSHTQIEQLMQSCLKEVFEGEEEVEKV